MNKIFIIGLPRTGTTSISVALLDHNFNVAHTAFTKRAFELADVISDAPCFSDYQQLDLLFPGSKFVYLDRDIDKWLPSIQMLLHKMLAPLDPQTGYFNPVLKRSFTKTFGLSIAEDPLNKQHLTACYLEHQKEVFTYFEKREDLLTIDVSQECSLSNLLTFLNIPTHNLPKDKRQFPKLNTGKLVDCWKEFKHPNKVNPNSAGIEHRKYFDYHLTSSTK